MGKRTSRREVGPGALFPVHGEYHELFRGLAKKVWDQIEVGKAYNI